MLVVGCLPEASSSLGQVFHLVERTGVREQKLLLVRMLQLPQSEILAERELTRF
jgi:hypothetical protein